MGKANGIEYGVIASNTGCPVAMRWIQPSVIHRQILSLQTNRELKEVESSFRVLYTIYNQQVGFYRGTRHVLSPVYVASLSMFIDEVNKYDAYRK